LLRLPAVGDNAATSDTPKRKRGWFQFSLRTLMIGVTLLAVPLSPRKGAFSLRPGGEMDFANLFVRELR
jgi:hypothetical protein